MKKFVSLLVCFALGCAVLAGCSKEIDDSETNLIISLYEGGYGTSAFQKIADKKEQRKESSGHKTFRAPIDTKENSGDETERRQHQKQNRFGVTGSADAQSGQWNHIAELAAQTAAAEFDPVGIDIENCGDVDSHQREKPGDNTRLACDNVDLGFGRCVFVDGKFFQNQRLFSETHGKTVHNAFPHYFYLLILYRRCSSELCYEVFSASFSIFRLSD